MSLHVPAGACIPVASVSPIHVPPVQRVLKHRLKHGPECHMPISGMWHEGRGHALTGL